VTSPRDCVNHPNKSPSQPVSVHCIHVNHIVIPSTHCSYARVFMKPVDDVSSIRCLGEFSGPAAAPIRLYRSVPRGFDVQRQTRQSQCEGNLFNHCVRRRTQCAVPTVAVHPTLRGRRERAIALPSRPGSAHVDPEHMQLSKWPAEEPKHKLCWQICDNG
jgi:hypothetical protein